MDDPLIVIITMIIIITCYLSTPFLIVNNSQRCEPYHPDLRPGSRLGEVDLSRLGPPKSSQVGFICRRRQFSRAQSVLGQVDFF